MINEFFVLRNLYNLLLLYVFLVCVYVRCDVKCIFNNFKLYLKYCIYIKLVNWLILKN